MPCSSGPCCDRAVVRTTKSSRTTLPAKAQPDRGPRSDRFGLTSLPMLHLFEEEAVKVRPMNRNVTEGACLILLCLVMEGRGSRSPRIDRERVALQAQQVHLATLQQTRI